MSRPVSRRRRAVALVVALAALVVLVSACRVDTAVRVDVADDGSGTVTVVLTADADAVARVPELAGGLRLDDARDAGWSAEGPIPLGDGGMQVRLTKPFESSSQLPVLLAEIAGEGVIFSDVVLRQSRSFASSAYDVQARIDPSPPVLVFSDDGLAAIFEGQPFGRPLADLILEAGRPEDSLGLSFSVTLPGAEESLVASDYPAVGDGSSRAAIVEGSTATWWFNYGDPAADVEASSVLEGGDAVLWLNVARAAGIGFGLVLLAIAVGWVVTLVRTPKGRGRRATRRRQQRAAAREAEASRPRKRLLRLLVVDVHGVIVRPTHPLEGLLLPVILAENPDIDPELVRDRHRKLVLGRLTADEFWSDLGLGPIGRDVETRYLSSFKLVPGLHPFLDRVSGRGLPVAAVGNQPREWGSRLRRMAQLEDSVSSWLVSGEVGAALPERPLFEATRRVMSVDLFDCLYLSSVPEYLDAAEGMGMATGYFAASPEDVQESEHTLIRGFDDILRGRSTPG